MKPDSDASSEERREKGQIRITIRNQEELPPMWRSKGKEKGQRALEDLGREQHGLTVMLFLFFFYLIGNNIRGLTCWIFYGYKLYTFST